MTITEWIANEAVKTRLAELIAVNNGSMEVVGQIGQPVPCTVNRYGRLGLTIQEAFELTYLRGMFEALAAGVPPSVMEGVRDAIGREICGITIMIATPEQRRELLCK